MGFSKTPCGGDWSIPLSRFSCFRDSWPNIKYINCKEMDTNIIRRVEAKLYKNRYGTPRLN